MAAAPSSPTPTPPPPLPEARRSSRWSSGGPDVATPKITTTQERSGGEEEHDTSGSTGTGSSSKQKKKLVAKQESPHPTLVLSDGRPAPPQQAPLTTLTAGKAAVLPHSPPATPPSPTSSISGSGASPFATKEVSASEAEVTKAHSSDGGGSDDSQPGSPTNERSNSASRKGNAQSTGEDTASFAAALRDQHEQQLQQHSASSSAPRAAMLSPAREAAKLILERDALSRNKRREASAASPSTSPNSSPAAEQLQRDRAPKTTTKSAEEEAAESMDRFVAFVSKDARKPRTGSFSELSTPASSAPTITREQLGDVVAGGKAKTGGTFAAGSSGGVPAPASGGAAGLAGWMPATPNATPRENESLVSVGDSDEADSDDNGRLRERTTTRRLEVQHDPEQSNLDFMRTIFPRFSLQRANARNQQHLSTSSGTAIVSAPTPGRGTPRVQLEDAGIELLCPDWGGAVLIAHGSSSVDMSSADDSTEEDDDDDDDQSTVRTLYLSLPSSITNASSSSGASRSSRPASLSSSRTRNPRNNETTLPLQLRETLLKVLDHASDKLECDKVIISVERAMPDFKSLLHGLCYVGGHVVSYGGGALPGIPSAPPAAAAVASGRSWPEGLTGSFSPHSPNGMMARRIGMLGSSLGSIRTNASGPRSPLHQQQLQRGARSPSEQGSEDMWAVEGSTLVATSESEWEASTMGLQGVQGLVPRNGLVLVAIEL